MIGNQYGISFTTKRNQVIVNHTNGCKCIRIGGYYFYNLTIFKHDSLSDISHRNQARNRMSFFGIPFCFSSQRFIFCCQHNQTFPMISTSFIILQKSSLLRCMGALPHQTVNANIQRFRHFQHSRKLWIRGFPVINIPDCFNRQIAQFCKIFLRYSFYCKQFS